MASAPQKPRSVPAHNLSLRIDPAGQNAELGGCRLRI